MLTKSYLFHQTTDFAPEKFSASSLYPTHNGSSSATHVPGHFDKDSDQGDASEVESEESWFRDPYDVQPEAQGASNVSQVMNDEVRALRRFTNLSNCILIASLLEGTCP